jgi:hypothetical protein
MGLRHTIDDARGAARSDGDDFPGAEGLRGRLTGLAEDVDCDEIAPTDAATGSLFEVMRAAAADATEMPRPGLSTLGGGDIQCFWSQDGRHLSLAISPTGGRRLQEVVSGGAGTRTLAVVNEPDRDRIFAAIRWGLGHGDSN